MKKQPPTIERYRGMTDEERELVRAEFGLFHVEEVCAQFSTRNRTSQVGVDRGGIGIVIVAHGGLASDYLAAVEHVVGRVSGIVAVSVDEKDDPQLKQQEIIEAADSVDTGSGVTIVTDMFGGAPSNLSKAAVDAPNRRLLYGANLPMLIKLAKLRYTAIDEAVETALEGNPGSL